MNIHLSGLTLLVFSIVVLYIGHLITKKLNWLEKYNIPVSVSAGLLFAILFNMLLFTDKIKVTFNLEIRNLFLLIFFASVGVSSKINQLLKGGKTFCILLAVMFVFIICQNIIGILGAFIFKLPLVNGLFAGSITFAGGHGTAITWSKYFADMGIHGVEEFGLIAATIGLILGGLVGGPVSYSLIKKYSLIKTQRHLFDANADPADVNTTPSMSKQIIIDAAKAMHTIFEISLTVVLGTFINKQLREHGLIIPDFLVVLIIGIIISSIAEIVNKRTNEGLLNIFGEISLDLFVVMTLFTLKFSNLSHVAIPLIAISLAQATFIAFFAYYVFFRFAGKNYDAAVMVAGFIGSGLGATPVGMANVEAVIHRFGISHRALLLIPLLGSFCTDIMNAVILRIFLATPIFHI
ncbi:MAG: sodium/glutamate symporter [Endozoicomonadaceae bacterium]|nr:sodium/glutamate symporter [Endozoicomonadaceae bacterium]